MLYEHKKHDGSLPIVGVNTFLNENPETDSEIELARSSEEEKQSQIHRLNEFHERNTDNASEALERLRNSAINNENVFRELMHAIQHCSLGQITNTFFEVGGQYRRNM